MISGPAPRKLGGLAVPFQGGPWGNKKLHRAGYQSKLGDPMRALGFRVLPMRHE
jgi:hypothetical protein